MPLAKRAHKIRQYVDPRGKKNERGEKKRRKKNAERRKQQQTDALDAIYACE